MTGEDAGPREPEPVRRISVEVAKLERLKVIAAEDIAAAYRQGLENAAYLVAQSHMHPRGEHDAFATVYNGAISDAEAAIRAELAAHTPPDEAR
jgi:hypothetical protein